MSDRPIDSTPLSVDKWDAAKAPAEIKDFSQKSLERADWYIAWYQKTKRAKARWSKFIRATCILLFILTALVPISNAYFGKYFHAADGTSQFLNLGYIFATLGAGLLSLDKFYGFSAGWVRINAAITDLQNAKRNFRIVFETAVMTQAPDTIEGFKALVEQIRAFDDNVTAIVKCETDQWGREFQAGNAQLSEFFQTKLNEQKPGDLQVNIADAQLYKSVELSLNGSPNGSITGGARLLSSLPPDNYELTLRGTRPDDTVAVKNAVAAVKAGALTSVDVKIGG
jgi:hypothetical protein